MASAQREQVTAGQFSIRTIEQVLNGKDLVQDFHKHDFYFVLALDQGTGIHEIDFIQYEIHGYCIFLLRPGQVHRLELTANSTGFLMQFDLSFYQPKNTISDHRWKKAASKTYCEVEAATFTKIHSILTSIFTEFTIKQEGYIEAVKANLDLFFIQYVRQSRNPPNMGKAESGYAQERFEELLGLLETNIGTMKNVSEYF